MTRASVWLSVLSSSKVDVGPTRMITSLISIKFVLACILLFGSTL